MRRRAAIVRRSADLPVRVRQPDLGVSRWWDSFLCGRGASSAGATGRRAREQRIHHVAHSRAGVAVEAAEDASSQRLPRDIPGDIELKQFPARAAAESV